MNDDDDRKRGFAAMTPEQRRELGSRGGKKANELRVSHRWTADAAKEAGRKGGLAKARNRKAKEEGTES